MDTGQAYIFPIQPITCFPTQVSYLYFEEEWLENEEKGNLCSDICNLVEQAIFETAQILSVFYTASKILCCKFIIIVMIKSRNTNLILVFDCFVAEILLYTNSFFISQQCIFKTFILEGIKS